MRSIIGMRRIERALLAVILLLAAVGLFLGWRAFWFLTDDAYIAFRYVSNSHLGHGYVWNPSPFLPVEGYTSFLWILLLDGAWRVLGVEPPESANWIALGFSYGTLLLAVAMILRIRWHSRLQRFSLLYAVLLVLFLILNRTFLAWSSSGLETAMMDFLLLLWVYVCVADRPPCRRAWLGALLAAVLALTRPDGLLFCAATAVLVLLLAFTQPDPGCAPRVLVCGFLPYTIVLAYQMWRVSFYGEWLPNTYYAKVVNAWPQSGLRYMLSFLLEYGIWFAAAVVGWAFCRVASLNLSRLLRAWTQGCLFSVLRDIAGDAGPSLIVVAALLFHVGYYTLIVGGDHFEYRVYAHVVPLAFVGLMWSLNRLRLGPLSVASAALLFVLLSMPVPWTHWMLTKNLHTRDETHVMRVPIAPHWPKPVRWYAQLFDRCQSWLIYYHVCMRHQEHKVFWQLQTRSHPSRRIGAKIAPDGYPVMSRWSVGVPSWVFPHVAIIDLFGLNDYVIARTPVPPQRIRLMAHARRPPRGYVISYWPNVAAKNGEIIVLEREPAMTGEYIAANERRWREALRTITQCGEYTAGACVDSTAVQWDEAR